MKKTTTTTLQAFALSASDLSMGTVLNKALDFMSTVVKNGLGAPVWIIIRILSLAQNWFFESHKINLFSENGIRLGSAQARPRYGYGVRSE